MPDLLVQAVDESIVKALKERAALHGRSAEAEHREILTSVLARPRRRSLAQALAAIPNVGKDADFERVGDRKFKCPFFGNGQSIAVPANRQSPLNRRLGLGCGDCLADASAEFDAAWTLGRATAEPGPRR